MPTRRCAGKVDRMDLSADAELLLMLSACHSLLQKRGLKNSTMISLDDLNGILIRKATILDTRTGRGPPKTRAAWQITVAARKAGLRSNFRPLR